MGGGGLWAQQVEQFGISAAAAAKLLLAVAAALLSMYVCVCSIELCVK